MANPIAGWYPDPAGDPSKLRYWDGVQWTHDYMDRPVEVEAEVLEVKPSNDFQAKQDDAQADAAAASAVADGQVEQPAGAAPQPEQPQATQVPPTGYAAQPQPTPIYSPQQVPPVPASQTVYELSSEDRTLRLIAFIFALISTISVAWALLPLAWMVPMTVHCWGLYKGTKANTTAFGVCSLIFLSIVTGILLLVSTKEQN